MRVFRFHFGTVTKLTVSGSFGANLYDGEVSGAFAKGVFVFSGVVIVKGDSSYVECRASTDRLMQFICFDASHHNGATSTPCQGRHSASLVRPVQFNRRETHGPSRLEDVWNNSVTDG